VLTIIFAYKISLVCGTTDIVSPIDLLHRPIYSLFFYVFPGRLYKIDAYLGYQFRANVDVFKMREESWAGGYG